MSPAPRKIHKRGRDGGPWCMAEGSHHPTWATTTRHSDVTCGHCLAGLAQLEEIDRENGNGK